MQAYGIIVDKYPSILGCDAAGEVTAVGSKVTQFKVGDRVAGCIDHENDAMGAGSFQLYANLLEILSGKIPDSLSFKEAVVLPLAICTACTALFEPESMGLPLPQVEAKPNGKVMLVWGGSSSVGSCGIQAAKAAGFEVAATAGAHNQEYCKDVGADYVFDYKSETLVEDVVKALQGKEFAGVFDAVFGEEVYTKSAEITTQLGGPKIMGSILPSTMRYEKELPGGCKLADSKSIVLLLLRTIVVAHIDA